MNFYRVDLDNPVKHGSYYVLASSMDEAAGKAVARDSADGGSPGGIRGVHPICDHDDESALILDA